MACRTAMSTMAEAVALAEGNGKAVVAVVAVAAVAAVVCVALR
jgi:hypothetical protein